MASLIAGFTGGPEIWIIGIVVLVLFGGAAIPKFAKGLGRAKKEFEEGIKEGQEEKSDGDDESDKNAEDKKTSE